MKGEFLLEVEWIGMIYKCTICGKHQIWNGFKYCPDCGSPTTEEVIYDEKYRDYQ